ncbi:MAG: phosphatase PAP2 family protein [Gaiellales bacterium]|nr:MAG: phosphatase PAP2 family protein [Gaiellales bacterium]
MYRRSTLKSFTWAFEGIVYVLRTQRNMKIHFAIAIIVFSGSLFFDLNRTELIALLLTISFVLVMEMINTAVEAAIDTFGTAFDPMAKIAKDVAAGAVLIAAVNAVAVAYLIFFDRLQEPSRNMVRLVRQSPIHLSVIALVLVILLVIVLKAVLHRGTPFQGGMPSGHSAVAFAGWTAITFISAGSEYGVLVSVVGLIMALLVAQSRVESGIHSTWEVVAGAVLGTLVTTFLFQLWG